MTRFVALLAIYAIALAGCASQQQTADENGLDRAKMAAVEKAAARVGVDVHWVNPPKKSR